MTPAPRWLREYLEERLPELAPLFPKSPDSPDAAAIHQWFDRLIEHFNSRGLVTPYQQRNRLVDARNAIKTRYGQDHPAFAIVNFSKETWWKINNHTAANPRTPNNRVEPAAMKTTATDSEAAPAVEAGPAVEAAAVAEAPAVATEATKPGVAEIQAKLTQAKERRSTLKATYDSERTQLAKQHQRLVEIKAKAEGKPVPVAPPAPAPTPAPAPDPVESATPAVAAAQPEKKPKGPGLLSRLGSTLKKLVSRKGKAGVPSAPASGTDDEADAERKDASVSAEAKGKGPDVDTSAAATALTAGAGASPEDKALVDQLNEVMREIQAIEDRLNKMEEQLRELDQQILGLEAELHEAELREAVIKEGEARASSAGEFHESREGEPVPTVPVTPVAAAGVAPQTNIGKAELTQVEETARRELANELRQGENVVLKGDYARLVRLDPDSYRVTDCGCDVVDGEAVPIFKLDAVLDPDTKEWVEAQQQRSEVVMEDEAAAVAPETPVARKGRGR